SSDLTAPGTLSMAAPTPTAAPCLKNSRRLTPLWSRISSLSLRFLAMVLPPHGLWLTRGTECDLPCVGVLGWASRRRCPAMRTLTPHAYLTPRRSQLGRAS